MVLVNIGCRDNLSVTSYIIKDTVRYFFMFFFLRYTKWPILPDKFILNNNISSTYKVQTPPPPFSIQKYYFSENFKISPLITFIEWWFYTYLLGTCVRIFISNDNEKQSRDKEWVPLVGMTICQDIFMSLVWHHVIMSREVFKFYAEIKKL